MLYTINEYAKCRNSVIFFLSKKNVFIIEILEIKL